MAITRKAKIWTIVLGTPVILIVIAVVAAKLYFTSERLKALVVPRLEEATGRAVSVSNISLSVLPSLSVEVDSLSIANAKGKDFSPGPFVSLEKLLLKVRLIALIKGNLEVTTVILQRPQLLVEVNKAGVANYSDLGGAPSEKPPEKGHVTIKTEPGGGGFVLSNFQIVDGTVRYVDRKEDTGITILGLNHRMQMEVVPVVNEAKLEGQTSVDDFSYGTARVPLIAHMRLTLDEQLSYSSEKDVLTIEKGVLTLQDMALRVSGTVSRLTRVPVLNLAVESDKLNIADLLSIIPKELMKKAEGMQGNGVATVKLSITGAAGDSAKPDIAGTIAASDASIRYARLPKPITEITILADFTRSARKQEFHLQKFSANLGNNPVSATMTVTNFDDPSVAMDVNASLNLAEVKDFYPLEAGTAMSGQLKANVSIAGKVSAPTAMRAKGTMEFQNVTVRSAQSTKPLENLQGSIAFNNQVIESRKLSMNLGKSDLTLAFSLRNYLSLMSREQSAPKPVANLTLSSSHLYSADIMTDTSSAAASGRGEEKARAKSRGSAAVLPPLTMDVSASIGTFTMEKFEFKNVRATAKLADGVITMQNFSMNVFDGSVVTKGTLNLQKPEQPLFDLALDISKVDAHAMLPKFTSFGERLYGRMTMNSTLKGALDDTLGLVPQSLNGQGRVQMENGKLTGVKINKSIADLLKLPDLENIQYKDWANTFTISNGRITIKDLKITALDADYVVNGSQGLDGSLDYTMSLILPERTSSRAAIPGFAGEAVNLFKDQSGRVKLDFSVGGTSDAPKVSLDTKSAQQKAEDIAKKKITDEAKKAQEQLKQKGEDLLKDLFKKKK